MRLVENVDLLDSKSADTLLEASRLAKSVDDNRQSAILINEAADMFVKAGSNAEACKHRREAVKTMRDMGLFAEAGKAQLGIANFLEQEGQFDEAADSLILSAELFGLAKHHSTDQTRAKNRAADILLKNKKIPQAISLYEEIAQDHLSNSLMRFHAKDLFIKCVLGLLLIDVRL